jgi:predicted dehydrogenase
MQDSALQIQRHWVECLQTGQTPENTGADNLKTLELVFGAYQSIETGQAYRLAT